MAVPKRKKSKSRVGMRKSANMKYAKQPVSYSEDQTTGELKRPHHVSRDGYYNGRNVFEKSADSQA
jgi:large subunit ribosomal protein L32